MNSSKPLRILAIVNLPWDPRLGAARVWIELAEQWRTQGHSVEKFSLDEAFPSRATAPALVAWRQMAFVRRAQAFVHQHGHRFDVIDALVGTLPSSKAKLGYHGLMVARSVGSFRRYHQFEREARINCRQGTLAGRLLYGLTNYRAIQAAESSLASADLVNLPNDDELISLRHDLQGTPAVVYPYGLSSLRRLALRNGRHSPAQRLKGQTISFIGMWGARKGARDWQTIVEHVWAQLPSTRFRFLGTLTGDVAVLRDLGCLHPNKVEIVREFWPDELPALLADCAVGVFPSYIEGFGLGLLEQLAAGIPTVAYDVPGPEQLLRPLRAQLLTPVGEAAAIADRALALLKLDEVTYTRLSNAVIELAAGYDWETIARDTIEAYRESLVSLADEQARRVVAV